jgi:hypothetical protein
MKVLNWLKTTDLFFRLSIAYCGGALGAISNGLMAILIYKSMLAKAMGIYPYTQEITPMWYGTRFVEKKKSKNYPFTHTLILPVFLSSSKTKK